MKLLAKSIVACICIILTQQSVAQISGIAFFDINANGIRTTTAPIEPLVKGIQAKVTLPNGTILLDTTDINGAYSFTAAQIPSGTKVA